MLTIPESVKALYKTDGTRKNFRVQFPNGEMADLTNADVVRESVHFTESICSQNVFRFGLAEASVIEFETVGVGNMYGMTIVCSYEIDTGSLSAAEISAIQADPGDGELVLASASDIGYGFYRVPLGVFRVEKCPRNHGAMTHRQVTAYQHPSGANFSVCPPDAQFLESRKSDTIETDFYPFILANFGYYAPSTMQARYSRTVLATESDMTAFTADTEIVTPIRDDNYELYRFTVDASGLAADAPSDYTTIFGWEAPKIDYEAIATWCEQTAKASMTNQGKAASLAGATMKYVGAYRYADEWLNPFKVYYRVRDNSVYSFYPWPLEVATFRYHAYFGFPTSITIAFQYRQGATWTDVSTQTFTASTSTATLYGFTPLSTIPSLMVKLPTKNTNEVLTDMMSGLYEALGEFGKADRQGGIEDFALSPSSPISISPGDYDECWWDEYDVSPIGTVTVTYPNGEEGEATADITLSAGASLYDMTDNEVLKNLSTADLDSITELLFGAFAANAQNVGFTPMELTMQGWPWMEAGDALQITAEDGTVVNTYALRVEMSGIQHLMSDITAEGGEIIGEV